MVTNDIWRLKVKTTGAQIQCLTMTFKRSDPVLVARLLLQCQEVLIGWQKENTRALNYSQILKIMHSSILG